MKKVKVNNHKLELYDGIDEMPIVNFQKYNKYLLIDSGIGSDVDDIDRHIAKIARYIKMDDKPKAMQELQNMRQNIYMVNNHISPKYLAFAALVKSVDGKEVTDLSDDSLKALLESISAVKHSLLTSILSDIKKKVSEELEVYFPEDFISPKMSLALNKQKARLYLILDDVITGKNHDKEIDDIDDSIAQSNAPKPFIGKQSVEVQYDKQFEETCLMLSQEGHISDPYSLTVLQFYSMVGAIKKQTELKSKIFKKHKVKRPKR